jgi:hypothetical protein
MLFAVEGTSDVRCDLSIRLRGTEALIDEVQMTPASPQQLGAWDAAQQSLLQLNYIGVDPNRPAPTRGDKSPAARQASFSAKDLETWAIRERVVFYDDNYDAHWVEQPDQIAAYFGRRGMEILNAARMTAWLTERAQSNTATGTSATFVMGNAPKSILFQPYEHSPLAQYLRAGGRVVWLSNVPLLMSQDEYGSIKSIGARASEQPREVLLGLTSDKNTYYGIEGKPVMTPAAKAWGLEPGLAMIRPVLNRGVAVSFVEDSSGEYCGVGMVNLCPANPMSGFIFVPNRCSPSDELLLRNVYRFASYSGKSVSIPVPTEQESESQFIAAQIAFGNDDRRGVYLRSEKVPVYVRMNAAQPGLSLSLGVRMLDGEETIKQWSVQLTSAQGPSNHLIDEFELKGLRQGIYPIIADLTVAGQTQSIRRELRVAAEPDHEGTIVSLWLSFSDKPRRSEYLFNWLKERDIHPLVVDERDSGRDMALWHQMSFSVRRHGKAKSVPEPAGYDIDRRR